LNFGSVLSYRMQRVAMGALVFRTDGPHIGVVEADIKEFPFAVHSSCTCVNHQNEPAVL
jgi:hypothetical protein